AVVAREDQKSDRHLVVYVVPAPNAAAADDGAQVDEWRQVHDAGYADPGEGPWGEDFRGWNSSYSGEPIPLGQMREWRDAAVAQVLRFGPRRVLEIGVGSGLLLAKIVGEVEEYWGTDISATVVDRVRAQAEQAGHGDRVHLSVQPAHDVSGLPKEAFDTIVLNSVAQYFPGADYLDQVLCQAMELLAPGGRVIVGDVRNASTLRLLQTAVQRAAHPHASREEVRALVEQALLAEQELVVAPEWFVEWAADRPVGVDIRLKAGQAHNELTRHRYEVILHKQPTDMFDLTRVPTVPWGREVSDLAGLGGCVDRADGGPVRVTGIPNARLAEEAAAGVLRADTRSGGPVDPEDLAAWARQQGRDAVITWSGETAHNFDAILLPEQRTGQRTVSGGFVPSAAVARTRANNPALAKTVGPLLAELRQHLRTHLPDYMVPATGVPLSELPLNPAGKLDRRTLPSKHTTTVSSRGPRNSHEEKLCVLFSELLGLERVGIDDSFFELGGHSLLATRLSARILKQFGVDIPLRAITEHPTVADLAALGLVGGTPDDRADSFAVVLPLNRDPGTGKPPVWFFHGGGGLGWPYFTFAPHLDRPAYALQSRGSNGKDPVAGSVQEMVDDYLTQILRTQPGGPYYLIGWSFGGPVAHAVAEALDRRGHEVALLAVLDTQPATPDPESGFKQVAGKTAAEYRAAVEDVLREVMSTDNLDSFLENMSNVGANNLNRMATFESPVYRGELLYFNATLDKTEETTSYGPGWRPYVLGSLEEYDVEATHHDLHMPKPAGQIMKVITRKLAEE
ncbi:alpha/beta fold hydrolase, partial [Streptomyces sp. ActVer]|uniref:alpha/beta fold hydrolase n=1 Tax=Streptomyces sp. ActVer TaxID=3014558 RepID=UPI0022B32008